MENAQIIPWEGRPVLYLDGIPCPPILYGLSDIPASRSNTAQAQRNIRLFAQAGIRLVTADTGLHLGWHKATPFDAEPLRAEIAGVLEANPDARIILRLHLNPPYWWMRDHPEELIVYDGVPGTDDGEQLRLIRDDFSRRMRVSLASRVWLRDAGAMLQEFCRQIADTPEGRSLMGIQVACGGYGEWHQWGTDTGPAMERRFRQYLAETYGDDDALRAAWGDDSVSIASAPFCPSPSQPGEDGLFRDPRRARRIEDAQRCIQQTPPEAILHFCRILKETWPRPLLTGAFYGYYLGTGGDSAVISGHLLPQMLFAHRELINFLCGPFPYMHNRLPDGAPMSRGLLESMRLNGILWLTEMDQHPVGTEYCPGGDPAFREETIAMLRRNVLLPQVAGMGLWYYDHRIVPGVAKLDSRNTMEGSIFMKKGWWDQPELLREISALQALAQARLDHPYLPVADVLVVYDPLSHFGRSRALPGEYALHDALGHSGAAYDCIYLQDLARAELPRYRLVIFANCTTLPPAQREEILRLTDSLHVLWFYAPGYSDGCTLDVAHIRALTGITVQKIPAATGYKTCAPLSPASISLDEPLSPGFVIADAAAQPLAQDPVSGACCAARKGNVWYFATPMISTGCLRYLLQEAGAHLYSDAGDVIMADGDWVVLHTLPGGSRKITLKNGKQCTLTVPPMTTAVLDAQTGRRLL